jgi:hypothetical protein
MRRLLVLFFFIACATPSYETAWFCLAQLVVSGSSIQSN